MIVKYHFRFNLKPMKRLLFCFLFLFRILFVNAQTETTKFIYQFDISDYADTILENQKLSLTLKFIKQNRNSFDDLGFAYLLDRLISENKITIYKDENCTQHFEKRAFPFSTQGEKYDSVFQKIAREAPLTKEEILFSLQSPTPEFQILFPNNNSVFQLIQNWNFDDKKQELSNSIKTINIGYFEANHFKRLCSIKNKPSIIQNITSELNKSSVIWAKQIHYKADFENDSFIGTLQEKIISEKHFKSHKIVNEKGQLIDNAVIDNYFHGLDTIFTVNPETFESEYKIVRWTYNPSDNTTYQIAQDFYFDTETNAMNTKILAIAPLRNYYDDFGNFRFTKLMFWIVYDDNFLKTFD